jgi:hypothetical protein
MENPYTSPATPPTTGTRSYDFGCLIMVLAPVVFWCWPQVGVWLLGLVLYWYPQAVPVLAAEAQFQRLLSQPGWYAAMVFVVGILAGQLWLVVVLVATLAFGLTVVPSYWIFYDYVYRPCKRGLTCLKR